MTFAEFDFTPVAQGAWRDQALCNGTDPEMFFSEHGGNYTTAKKMCARCPVRMACLEDAIATGEEHGIRGGVAMAQYAIAHARPRESFTNMEEVLTLWATLPVGTLVVDAAPLFGIAATTLDSYLRAAKKKGDPRAVFTSAGIHALRVRNRKANSAA